MKKKIIGIFISILLIGIVFPVSGIVITEKTSITISLNGNTLYVGGTGPGNYTSIQDAINDAVDGDTVFVYDDSSPYQLTTYLSIEKSINLIGENRETTVISGSIDIIDDSADTEVLIVITETDWANISGFTFKNSQKYGIAAGKCDYINISGNIFIDTGDRSSILLFISNHSYISDNIFTSTKVNNIIKEGGLWLEIVSYTTISGNIFTNCFVGMTIGGVSPISPYFYSNNNIISGNLFDNNNFAMEIRANNTLITRNTISNHTDLNNLLAPALILKGQNNIITCNNFINNIRDANNGQYIFSPPDRSRDRKNRNVWDGNYWGRPRSLPKFIWSYLRYERAPPNPAKLYPLITIDWHPAKEPNDINLTQNYEINNYLRTIKNPLLEQFPLLSKLLLLNPQKRDF